MLSNMNIPKKLGVSFLVISMSAAVMTIVFFANIWEIRSAAERNNHAREVYAKALTLETSILRENSQLRGFLVTGDKSYLKSYDEARKEYDTTSRELTAMLTDPAELALVAKSREETTKWRRQWSDRLTTWVKAGRRDEAQQAVRDAGKAVLTSAIVLPLRDIRDQETAAIEENAASQNHAIDTAIIALVLGGIMLIGIAITLQMLLSRSIARPITMLTQRMADLAQGQNDIAVPGSERGDELGDMARAVVVFRDAAKAKVDDDRERELALQAIGTGLHSLSQADLTARLTDLPPAFHQLAQDFNGAVQNLSSLTSDVRGSAGAIRTNIEEIRQATDHLSARSEQQAASLRETAAAVGEITQGVRDGAINASQANRAVTEARDEAASGAFDKAVPLFEKLEGRAAGTPLAQQAQLDKAYAQYKSGDKVQATATLDRFLKLHPASPATDYALYLKGLVNFNDNLGMFSWLSRQDLSERDQKAAKDSFESFRELVTRFPESRYAEDSRLRMQYIVNSLAQYEVHVARYYYGRGAYVAAIARAQTAVKDYQGVPAVREAMQILVNSYDALGMTQLRDDAQRVLTASYGQDSDKDVTAKQKSWWKLW